MFSKNWNNLGYISEKLSDFKGKVLDNKLVRFVFSLIFIVVFLLILLPSFLDNELLKNQSIKKINELYDVNLLVKGDVSLRIFPTPVITVKDVLLQRYQKANSKYIFSAYAKSIKINFEFLSFQKIKKITLINALIERREGESGQMENGEDMKNITLSLKEKYQNEKVASDSKTSITHDLFFKKDSKESIFNFKNSSQISLENSKFITYNENEEKKEYSSVFLTSKINKEKINISGGFAVLQVPSSFEALMIFDDKMRSKPNSFLTINSPSLKLKFNGNLAKKEDGLDFDVNGKLAMEITDLQNFYLSYLGQNKAIASKLKNNTPSIIISAVISSNDGEKTITNLNIKSPIINGTGSAYIGLLYSKVPIIDLSLDLKDIDLDAIWSGNPVKQSSDLSISKETSGDESEVFFDNSLDFSILEKDFDLIAEIKSEFVRYKNNNLGNLNIYLNSYNRGEIIILPLSFDFPGEGKFYASGVLGKENSVKFIGKIHISGKDYSALASQSIFESRVKFDFIKDYELYSDIVLFPSKIELNNLFLKLNEGFNEISGNVNFDISESVPEIQAELLINNLDATKYLESLKIDSYINDGNLLRKFFWLNELTYDGFFKLKCDKIFYKNQQFDDNSANFVISRGKIGLNNLVLKQGLATIESSLIVDISKNIPYLEFRLNADELDILSENDGKIINDFEAKSVSSKFFKLTSLEGFSGILNINAPSLKFKNNKFENFSIKSNLNNGIFEDLFITFKNLNSQFEYKGSIGVKQTKTISGTATVGNLNVASILEIADIKNISGISNIALAISSYGKNSVEFLQNLEGEIKATVNGLVANRFGLNDLVQKMFQPRQYFTELKEPNLVLMNEKTKTIFQKANASIKIKEGFAVIKSDISGLAFNSILSGRINLENYDSNMVFNTVFITGTRKKQIPISVATNFSGKINNLSQSTNYDQILQYLGLKKIEKPVVVDVKNNILQEEIPQNQVIIER